MNFTVRINDREVFVSWENRGQKATNEKQIKIGDVVTVKHSGFNEKGTLIFPTFIGKREDLTWEDLLENKT